MPVKKSELVKAKVEKLENLMKNILIMKVI